MCDKLTKEEAERDKAEYHRVTALLKNLYSEDLNLLERIAKDELKQADPKWSINNPGQTMIFNWKLIEVYKRSYE